MRKNIPLFAALFAAAGTFTAASQSTFETLTTFSQPVFVKAVAEDPSGHLLVMGETTIGGGPFGGGEDKIVLMKHKPDGTLLWTKYYNSAAEDGSYHISLAAAGDHYAMAGFVMGTGTNSRDGLLIVTDTSGTVLHGIRADHTGSNAYHSVSPTPDGWVLAGRSDGGAGGSYDLQLTHLMADGTPGFSRTYGGSDWDWAYWAETYADGFIVAGYGDSFGGGFSDPILIRTDGTGNVLWARTISTPTAEDGMYCTSDSQGNIYFSGYTLGLIPGDPNIKGFVAKINTSGDLQWCKAVSGWASIPSICITPDDRVILVGDATEAPGGLGGQDIGLVRLSSEGEPLGGYRYGSEANDYVNHIITLADGQLLLGGNTGGFGALNQMPWLLKLTSAGLADCHYVAFDFTVTDVSITLSDPVLAVSEGITHFDWALNTENIAANGQMLCCPPDAVAQFSQNANGAFVHAAQNADEVVWTVNGVVQPAVGNVLQYTFLPGLTYVICLTATNACSTDELCQNYFINPNGVGEKDRSDLTLWPNPTADGFRLHGLSGMARVVITDMSGRVLQDCGTVMPDNKVSPDLPSGVYLVRVMDAFGSRTLKVVFQ